MNRTGWALGAASVVLAVAGFTWNLTELVVAGVAGLATCVYAVAVTRSRGILDVERAVMPVRVAVGEPASLAVTVTNGARGVSPGVLVRQYDGVTQRQYQIAPLAPGEHDRQLLPLDTSRRGIYPIAPTELALVDPLVLAGRASRHGEELRLVVHPRVHALAPAAAISQRDVEGLRSDRWGEGSESFHALREYTSGDDHRLIHWRSSARTGELVVKQFVDLWLPELLLVVDTRASHYDERHFELAMEVAASISVASARHRHATTILLGTGESASSGIGGGHEPALLDLLAAARLDGDASSLAELASLVSKGQRDRALVLVAGDAPGEQLLAFLRTTGTYQRRLVVRIRPGHEGSPIVEVSRRGDEAIAASTFDDFAAAWARLPR